MVLTAGLGVTFGQNDLVGIFRAIDRSHMRAIIAANFHVLIC
jgi:hypothetical protein